MKQKILKGFTMVELLVAMAIIGLLIATAIWGIGIAQISARNTQRREAGAQILAGLSEYYSRYNTQPVGVCGTATGIKIQNLACTAAGTQTYTLTLSGAALPKSAVGLSIATTPGTTYKDEPSTTTYIIRTPASETNTALGYMICVYLEGGSGGVANLSDPSTLVCP